MTAVGWQYEDDASRGTIACASGSTSGAGADGEIQFAKSSDRAASEGVATYEIVRRVGWCAKTVRKWRWSFPNWDGAGEGVIEPGRGRKPRLPGGPWPRRCGSPGTSCPRTARPTGPPAPWASAWGSAMTVLACLLAGHEPEPLEIHDPRRLGVHVRLAISRFG